VTVVQTVTVDCGPHTELGGGLTVELEGGLTLELEGVLEVEVELGLGLELEIETGPVPLPPVEPMSPHLMFEKVT
jgi:hypothetical protein